jgi:hypothetical protein
VRIKLISRLQIWVYRAHLWTSGFDMRLSASCVNAPQWINCAFAHPSALIFCFDCHSWAAIQKRYGYARLLDVRRSMWDSRKNMHEPSSRSAMSSVGISEESILGERFPSHLWLGPLFWCLSLLVTPPSQKLMFTSSACWSLKEGFLPTTHSTHWPDRKSHRPTCCQAGYQLNIKVILPDARHFSFSFSPAASGLMFTHSSQTW